MGAARESGFWRTFLSVTVTSLLIVVILLALALQAVPRVLGGTSLTVLTGSMEPVISPGDVIAIREVSPDDIRVGDIVTFQPISNDPALITHRVIGVGENSVDGRVFVTQGDANGAPDPEIVADQVRGVYMYRVPLLGYVLRLGGSQGGATIVLVGLALVAFAAVMLWRSRRRPERASEQDAAAAADSENPVSSTTADPDTENSVSSTTADPDAALPTAPAPSGPAAAEKPPSGHPVPGEPVGSSRRERRRGAPLLAVLLIAGAVVEPTLDPSPAAAASDVLGGGFTGPTVALDWTGAPYSLVTSSFFGDRVVVPGDQVARQIRVTNSADDAGALTARIVNVRRTGGAALEEGVSLAWTAFGSGGQSVFGDAERAGGVVVDGLTVPGGGDLLLTLAATYPFDATTGARRDLGTSVLSFDVELVLREDASAPGRPLLPATGAYVSLGLIGLGAVAVCAGIAGIIETHRRRELAERS